MAEFCADINGGGKSSDFSPGCKTSRRVATRFDYKAENYLGFVHLGCIVIFLRAYL
jgi:hypothetical protein